MVMVTSMTKIYVTFKSESGSTMCECLWYTGSWNSGHFVSNLTYFTGDLT